MVGNMNEVEEFSSSDSSFSFAAAPSLSELGPAPSIDSDLAISLSSMESSSLSKIKIKQYSLEESVSSEISNDFENESSISRVGQNQNQEQRRSGCPFHGEKGFCTADGRSDWINIHNLKSHAHMIPTTCIGNPDQSTPLYYWQLHSIIGPEVIETLVRAFYTSVYEDTDDLMFRDAFASINPLNNQVIKQTKYWIDAFGGGFAYPIGEFGIKYHHELASHVMNAKGAKRWMHHMANALCSIDLSDIDVRVKPCIIDFIKTKMIKYAYDHKWEFDDSDFDFVKHDPEMVGLFEAEVTALTLAELNEMSVRDLKNILYFNGVAIPRHLEAGPRSIFGLFQCGGSLCGRVDRLGLIKLVRDVLRDMILSHMKRVNEMELIELRRFLNQRGVKAASFSDRDMMVDVALDILRGYLKSASFETHEQEASSQDIVNTTVTSIGNSSFNCQSSDVVKEVPIVIRSRSRPSYEHVKSVFGYEPSSVHPTDD